MSNPVGRPSLYKDEYVEQLLKFFDVTPFSLQVVKDAKGNERTEVLAGTFPTLARFATKIGVTRDTLYEWSTATDDEGNLKHPDFSYAYKRAKDFQEAILVEGAMAGAFQANFSIFTAKNVLGWRDKIEQELSGPGGAELKTGFTLVFEEPNNGNDSGS
jgi:hypothetical protein